MDINKYNSDPRYWAVWEKMQLLGIEDVSTKRQEKNGTIVWRLPIKNNWPGNNKSSYIEVASFKTGYVRNQNSGYSNYQLNKRCMGEPEYFKSYKWVDGEQVWDGKYRKFETRQCVLIPIEIERLEYLIKYCVKNYYIKHANQVPNGDFYPKWMYDDKFDRIKGSFLKCKDTDDMINFEYSGGQIRNMENGDTFVHEQHAYWNKWKEDSPASSVELIIDGHRYKVK